MSDDEELLYGLLGTQFNVENDIDTENRRQKLKRKAIEDEVTDEKGRALRFHGAFTGGFHAGYFNTVGSKEGFTPQQYVSQGRKGAKPISQFKPEDFMDEEDFSEHGIAPKLLKTKAVFDDEDMRKQFKQYLGSNSIIGDSDILKDILIPQRLTIGMILLKKLGYISSRGVGDKEKEEDSDSDDHINAKKIEKFNYEAEEMYQLVGQMNKFGLGYSGIRYKSGYLNRENEKPEVNFGYKDKRGIKGTAFGAGVDEDEEDTEDYFGGDSMTKYNFEIVEDDDKEMNFGWTAPKKNLNAIMEAGTIDGFQLSRTQAKNKIIYEPPIPPRFFNPIYPVRSENSNNKSSKLVQKHKLMPDEDPKSVFNLISVEDKKRLLNSSQDKRNRKSGSRWGDASITNLKMEDDVKCQIDSILGFYKPPEKSVTHRKDTKKSWNLSSDFASMFKSAGKSTETQDINYCLNSLNSKKENDDNLENSLKVDAANLENFGFLTRKIVNWHPDKLLCKRFNVADPYPGSKFSGIPDMEIPTIEPEVLAITAEPTKIEPDIKPVVVEPAPPGNIPINTPIDVEIKTTILDVSVKPPIDLFKSVFADSDAEFSSSEDELPEPIPEKDNKFQEPQEPQISIVSSLEQALNRMIGGISQPVQQPSVQIKQPEPTGKVYGPSIPPGFVPSSVVVDHIPSDVNKIISKNIKEAPKDPLDNFYEFKEKPKTKKSKKEKKSKKKKSKKKSHH